MNFDYWKAWQATPPKAFGSPNYILNELRVCGSFSPIPNVQLAPNLIQKLRQYSIKSGHSLSEVVTLALETFLRKGRGRGRKQEHIKTDQA